MFIVFWKAAMGHFDDFQQSAAVTLKSSWGYQCLVLKSLRTLNQWFQMRVHLSPHDVMIISINLLLKLSHKIATIFVSSILGTPLCHSGKYLMFKHSLPTNDWLLCMYNFILCSFVWYFYWLYLCSLKLSSYFSKNNGI